MKFTPQKLKNKAKKEIKGAKNLNELNEVFARYFGEKGEISSLTKRLRELPEKKRKTLGKKINALKEYLKELFDKKREELEKVSKKELEILEKIDVTVPGVKVETGTLHPLTLIRRKIEEIFSSLGFSIVEGPEIENEWYNFDALNIPKDHPARDLWNTFYLKVPHKKEKKYLLRTHTSPVQVRYMEKHNPPFRIIVPGRVFRHEATDSFHEINFHQVEGLMVDKEISVANFKGIIEEFLKRFFNKEIKFRLRPSYFPFTEPSFEVDIACLKCQGEGCENCASEGWLEVMGAGMVHPNVFKNSGLNPKEWQGFAFGLGLERLTMLKFGIQDIRLFFKNDLRVLKQF